MEAGLLGASMPQPIDSCLKTLGRLMLSGPKSGAVMASSWQPLDILGKGSASNSKKVSLEASAHLQPRMVLAVPSLSPQAGAVSFESAKDGHATIAEVWGRHQTGCCNLHLCVMQCKSADRQDVSNLSALCRTCWAPF